MTTLAPPDLLTTCETARILRVEPGTLANWRYLGRGPSYVKDGHVVRYRRTDVTAYLEERTVTTDA